MGLGNITVSLTKVSTPSGRILWELVAVDLPPFFRKNALKNGVRAYKNTAFFKLSALKNTVLLSIVFNVVPQVLPAPAT